MTEWSAVVFDVDGTLLNTSEGVLSSVRYTIEAHGLAPLSDEELRRFIGPPIQDSFARVYGLSGDILQELATTFRDRYKGDDLFRAVPYDGIFEVFDELKRRGIPIAVATYKREDYAKRIMHHFGFDRYTDIIYGADHENRLKKADIIRKCLTSAGVASPADAVMVGDSDNDAVGAQNIGLKFLGVTYGFGFRKKEEILCYEHAVGCAASSAELIPYLTGQQEVS
ncbi:MAG: HAD hydrolase-like protein [Lachnospiraceae bacterium]|nr:HAD hydrolase-like protein [Lachnospiraceae bacterium]